MTLMSLLRFEGAAQKGEPVKRTLALGVASFLVVVAAACGNDDDTSSSPADSGAQATPAETADDAEPAPSVAGTTAPEETAAANTASEGSTAAAGETDPDATFRVVRHVGAVNFDPHRSPCTCDEATHTPVYSGLVQLTKDAVPEPGLAESWEYSDDGLTLTMALREGVTFQDGEPFNAEAAKANLERAKTMEGSTVSGALAKIGTVDAVDDMTLQINLSEPDAALLAQLATFPGMMISPAAFDKADLDVMPVGAGPYRVVEHRPNDLIVYERVEDYWNPDAQGSARIEIRVVPDANARFNSLRTGEADAGVLLSTALFKQAADTDGLVAEPTTLLSFEALYMNRTRSELGNELARKAIMHAIDREALVAAVLGGLGEPQLQPFPPEYYAYNPDLPEELTYQYDPDKARELLAEAGLEDGFTFQILYPAYNEPAATAVQAMLAEVGITAQIEAVEPAAIAERFYVQQDGDAMLSSVSGQPDPQVLFQYRYMPDGRGNPGGHTTPEFEALFNDISVTVDPDEREALIHDAVVEIMDSVLEAPLYSVGAFLGPVKTDCVAEYGGGLYGSRLQEAALKADCG
jgi:peptide/nickel transport system substrate-binding protein